MLDVTKTPSGTGSNTAPAVSAAERPTISISETEQKRLTPRSPRAALQPDKVPEPKVVKPSKRARHPIIIVGNAIFTFIILAAIVGGLGLAIGKQRFESPGPLDRERVVNIPRSYGIKD